MSRKKHLIISLIMVFIIFQAFTFLLNAQDSKLFSREFLDLLNNEISGEIAYGHVVNLSGWPKNRPAKEYTDLFYETKYVMEKTREYGLDQTDLEVFPWKYSCWDPVSAELWMVQPEKRKITGLEMVHLCLMEGSKNADVTAELIDMDMVGEGHSLCGTRFHIFDTPDSLPHFFNAVMKEFAEYVRLNSGWMDRVGEKSFTDIIASPTGSRDAFYYDMIHFNPRFFNENWIGIPSILFNCGPDPFYHSSEDRPDKCDPTQLKRAAFLGTAAALYLADLGRDDLSSLIPLVMAEEEVRLGADSKKAIQVLSRSNYDNIHQNYKEALNIIRHGLKRYRGVILSIGSYLHFGEKEQKELADLVPNEKTYVQGPLYRYYMSLCRMLNRKPEKPTLTAEETRLSRLIPERLVGYELLVNFMFLEDSLDDPDIKRKIRLNQAGRDVTWEVLNFSDGIRSIVDIRDAVAAEFAPVEVSLEDVEEYLKILEKAGVVRISMKED